MSKLSDFLLGIERVLEIGDYLLDYQPTYPAHPFVLPVHIPKLMESQQYLVNCIQTKHLADLLSK